MRRGYRVVSADHGARAREIGVSWATGESDVGLAESICSAGLGRLSGSGRFTFSETCGLRAAGAGTRNSPFGSTASCMRKHDSPTRNGFTSCRIGKTTNNAECSRSRSVNGRRRKQKQSVSDNGSGRRNTTASGGEERKRLLQLDKRRRAEIFLTWGYAAPPKWCC